MYPDAFQLLNADSMKITRWFDRLGTELLFKKVISSGVISLFCSNSTIIDAAHDKQ